ncbi:hypothetical protein MRB53_018986 [Persea americana]|uniref:Uncharacterized protein n=1 Tax=Persea americana TaxID=3435 RepID=A0ACC2M9G3_PERAE|nr:hypothetical protein MRB53_018986 [Persea americana]
MSGTGSGMNTRYYVILDVSKTVLQEGLKMAYFIASNVWVFDPEKSKEVAEAYEVLSDPEKLEIYDQNGEDTKNGWRWWQT